MEGIWGGRQGRTDRETQHYVADKKSPIITRSSNGLSNIIIFLGFFFVSFGPRFPERRRARGARGICSMPNIRKRGARSINGVRVNQVVLSIIMSQIIASNASKR